MEHGASPRQRTAVLLSTLVVHLLLLVLLLRQSAWQPPIRDERRLVTFQLAPDAAIKPRPTRSERANDPMEPPPPPPSPVPQPPETPELLPPPSPAFLVLSKDAFAAVDIGKIAGRQKEADTGTGNVYGPGEGPGGIQLQDADWFRKPTNAELAFYLPSKAPSGFGMIACQTAPGYHVENCRVIDQTPGMGLGQAVRKAAWQFLVVPPRVNGRPVIGAWVRIRIDYSRVTVGAPPRNSQYPRVPPDPPEQEERGGR